MAFFPMKPGFPGFRLMMAATAFRRAATACWTLGGVYLILHYEIWNHADVIAVAAACLLFNLGAFILHRRAVEQITMHAREFAENNPTPPPPLPTAPPPRKESGPD